MTNAHVDHGRWSLASTPDLISVPRGRQSIERAYRDMSDTHGAPSTSDSATTGDTATGATQANQPPDWYTKPPEWLKDLQKPASSTPDNTAQPNTGNGPGAQLLNAINALPERIIAGLKEANPKPQTAEQTATNSNTNAANASGDERQSPGNVDSDRRTRFQKFWFGG